MDMVLNVWYLQWRWNSGHLERLPAECLPHSHDQYWTHYNQQT